VITSLTKDICISLEREESIDKNLFD